MKKILPKRAARPGVSDCGTRHCQDKNRAAYSRDIVLHALRVRKVSGFTLVELIITMSVVLVLTLIAVPSFQQITLSNRLTTTSNELVGAINVARTEAIKRNANTQFCGSTSNGTDVLGSACQNPGEVYVLTQGLATKAVTAATGLTSPIVLTGNMTAIRFGGQGLGHSPTSTAPLGVLIADVSTTSLSTDNHRCIKLTAGSIIVTTKSSTACQ